MNKWEYIRNVVLEEGLVKGDFTTSSGFHTDHYYDLRKVMSNPRHLWDIVLLICSIGVSDKYKSVGCMAMGAIPLVTAISLNTGIPYFYVRPEVKKHGMKQQIEGTVLKPYLIIDDVYTTGKSIQQVRKALGDLQAPFLVIINRTDSKSIDALYTEEDFKK